MIIEDDAAAESGLVQRPSAWRRSRFKFNILF